MYPAWMGSSSAKQTKEKIIWVDSAWFVYDQPMAAHGFLAYMLEIYLVTAAELGALNVVQAFFASFARSDGEVYDLLNGNGICNILLMLDDETFPNFDAETVDKQVNWVL
jgi:hypothetical protein